MLKVIAAIATNRIIGLEKGLPWKQKDDLLWFKKHTIGIPVVMGKVTYFTIPPEWRPLPGRENIVLTRNPKRRGLEGVTVLSKFEDVLERSRSEDLFVIGGAEIYSIALPFAEELYLTRIHANLKGDTFFPRWNSFEWKKTFSENHTKDSRNEHDFTFEIYVRKSFLHLSKV